MHKEIERFHHRKKENKIQEIDRKIADAVKEASDFFHEEIPTPDVPDEFYKTSKQLEKLGFPLEALVLPEMSRLREGNPLWYGIEKPCPGFFDQINNWNYPEKIVDLQAGLYLIDWRRKPNYKKGQQKYPEDLFIEGVMKDLRAKGVIGKLEGVPDDSRFGITAEEIGEQIVPEITRRIGKKTLGTIGKVMEFPYIMFNVIGNMRHDEWGHTTTYEAFGDKVGRNPERLDHRIYGGNSERGGLASVHDWTGDRNPATAFRLMIRFDKQGS